MIADFERVKNMSFPIPVKYGTDSIEYSDERSMSFPSGGDGSSGTGGFIVQMTATDTPMVTDKTFGEMYAAWEKSIPIFVKVKFSGDEYMCPVANMYVEFEDDEPIEMSFKIVNYKQYVGVLTFIPNSGNNDFGCKEWKLEGGD